MAQDSKPIFAEASGNTFLIFDYLDKYEHNLHENIVRRYHQEFGFERIDSCLVLTKVSEEFKPTQLQSLNSVLLMRMYVYEPGDGFCGNGARVVSKYCFHKYKNLYSRFFILCNDNLHELLQRDAEYLVEMGQSCYDDPAKEFIKKGVLDDEGKLIAGGITWHYVSTSEPHLITSDKIDEDKLISIGNSLNQDPRFPIGINLNRVLILDNSTINVLTFERGINRLTLSCGSGSTSCATLSRRLKLIDQAKKCVVTVKVRGGYMVVHYEDDKVYLSGPSVVEGIDKIE